MTICLKNGVIPADKNELKLNTWNRKYKAMNESGRLLAGGLNTANGHKNARVTFCMNRKIDKYRSFQVSERSNSDRGHVSNLMMCGSVWTCPVCASKMTERKSEELRKICNRALGDGKRVLLVTLTVPHGRDDELEDLLNKFGKAENGFSKSRKIRGVKEEIGFIEAIKSLEITISRVNGWHPHSHQLWVVSGDVSEADLEGLLYEQWANFCVKRGLGKPSRARGVDVRSGENASNYISKMGWNIHKEVAKGHAKKGKKGSFAPFDLLEMSMKDDKWAAAKFKEYAEATHGKHFISRFPKLSEMYGVDDSSEKELAEESTEVVTKLRGNLNDKQMQKLRHSKQLMVFLIKIPSWTWDEALLFIRNLPEIKQRI